jgi:hypothetical protein
MGARVLISETWYNPVRSLFPGLQEHAYCGHRNTADNRARHAFDHKDVGNSRLVRAPAASHDRQSLDLEKVSAQRAGNETYDAMADGSEAVVMQAAAARWAPAKMSAAENS